MKFTQEWEAEIAKIMSERGVGRKSAVQFWRRQDAKTKATITTPPEVAKLSFPVTDDESAAPAATQVAPITETRTVIAVSGAPTVNPSDPASVAAAKESAKAAKKTKKQTTPKADKPKGKPGRKSKIVAAFDAAKAVALYKDGKKVVDIAVALGYPRTKGQNRVRAALLEAGVYKGKGSK